MNSIGDFINLVILIASFQGFLLSTVLLFGHRHKIPSNKYLAGILILYSVAMVLHTMYEVTGWSCILFKHHIGFLLALYFCYGPLIYGFTTMSLSHIIIGHKKLLRHYVLAPVASIIIIISALIGTIYEFVLGILSVFVVIHILTYIVISFIKLAQYAHRHENKQKIQLLRIVLASLSISWLTVTIAETASLKFITWDYVLVTVAIVVYYIGYIALLRPELFMQSISSENPDSVKYQKTGLPDHLKEKYIAKLLEHMHKEKPFLISTITMPEVAKNLGIQQHHLSQVINERLNKNFFDFINTYRIDEAKKILSDPTCKHLTISAICYDIGFNSLSTFNAAFKKKTGYTPSAYRKKHLTN